ncbi:MAG TPA: 50S ribosomal protein L29 [Anaerolineales bacterium]|jgi:large subunit ribosomal protein L29
MKVAEIRSMSSDEIVAKLEDTRDEYFRLRFRIHSGQLTDHAALGLTRRTIARLATVLRERQLAAELQGETDE